jgi:hypothetical protein
MNLRMRDLGKLQRIGALNEMTRGPFGSGYTIHTGEGSQIYRLRRRGLVEDHPRGGVRLTKLGKKAIRTSGIIPNERYPNK